MWHWLKLFRWKRAVPMHQHEFVRLVRLHNPRRDVEDCSCGMRRVVTYGQMGEVGLELKTIAGSSIGSCLLNKNNCHMQGSQLL